MAYDQTIKTLREQEDNHWAIGDALTRELRTKTDWAGLDQALTGAGIDYKISTLRAYYRVAVAFPESDRVDGVSFAAHQAALTIGRSGSPGTMIDRAKAANGGRATRDAVLAEVRQAKGRTRVDTADATAAWRDLARGVEKILSLDEASLEALLQVAGGRHAGQAPALISDLTKAGTRIGKALAKAEQKAKSDAAKRKAKAARAAQPTTPKVQAPKARATEAKKPRVTRLGQGRGED